MIEILKTMREENEYGFTLIELLVVILIIGILAAIAIPVFLNQRKHAVDAGTQSDVKNSGDLLGGKHTGQVTIEDLKKEMPAFTQGTVIAVYGSYDEGYCVQGYNPNGYRNTTNPVAYDSLAGGILTESMSPEACPATVLTTPIAGGEVINPGDNPPPVAQPVTDPNLTSDDGSDPNYWVLTDGNHIYQDDGTYDPETGEMGTFYGYKAYVHTEHQTSSGTATHKVVFDDNTLNSNAPVDFQFHLNGTFHTQSVYIIDGRADFQPYNDSNWAYYGPVNYDQKTMWR